MKKIVFIGAGNVATHLSKALHNAGFYILQIVSRSENFAKILAGNFNTCYTTDISKIIPDADFYFLCVNDASIETVAQQIKLNNPLLIHTSGSVDINVLSQYSENVGVFYPLQTFSKTKEVNIKEIPICIEANTSQNFLALKELAESISTRIYEINSLQRRYLHLAAVFANNFSNLMFTVAEDLLLQHNVPFELIKPLILETASKATTISPSLAQTGPAVRNDQSTINKHLEMLKDNPQILEIYKLLTDKIILRNKK